MNDGVKSPYLPSPFIHLRCPKCGLTKDTPRIGDEDPPRAHTALILCPDCNAGDFDTPTYLDIEGSEVPWYEGLTDE